MVIFTEPFVGGFFGFGRTYGAVARFECTSAEALEIDWPIALLETAKWRAVRNHRATVLHLYFQVPAAVVPAALAFVAAKVMMPPALLAESLRGLCLEVNIFTPELEHHMHLVLYPGNATIGSKSV